jgi:hypothetical protein
MFARFIAWIERVMAPGAQLLADLPPSAVRQLLYRV